MISPDVHNVLQCLNLCVLYDDTCDDAMLKLIFGVTSLALIRDMSGTYMYNPQSKQQGITILDLGKIFAERSEIKSAKVTTLFLDEDVKISREMRRVCDAILRDETKGNCSLHVFRFRRQLRVSFRRFLSQKN